jgi:phage terminase large subunit-like protein
MRQQFLARLTPAERFWLAKYWPLWARPSQLPPPGDWRIWLLLAGRGFGKTRAGAEWVCWLAETGTGQHIALVGETLDDVRHVMVEGGSGVLAVSSAQQRPRWYPSRRLLVWENGCQARCFAAEAPDQLRGPEFDHAWADEIAKWHYPEALDNLLLALRRGAQPRLLATTTPRRDLLRIVLGVDPAIGGADETGLIIAGRDSGGMIWILQDASLRAAPDRWVAQIAALAEKWRLEAVVAEINQGGQLIETLLRQSGIGVPVRRARAMRSKQERAQPIAAAYARGQVRHAADFETLCDQMCALDSRWAVQTGQRALEIAQLLRCEQDAPLSPDRRDKA